MNSVSVDDLNVIEGRTLIKLEEQKESASPGNRKYCRPQACHQKVLNPQDPRLFFIVKRSSAYKTIETIGYIQRLEELFDEVYNSCLPVIWVYFEKLPKTTGQS